LHRSLSYRPILLAITAAFSAGALPAAAKDIPAEPTHLLPIKGVVTSTTYQPGSTTDPIIRAGYYQGALVCVDLNNNGKCDPNEKPAITDKTGNFTLAVPALASTGLTVSAIMASPIIADIGTGAINTATGARVSKRNVFRASWDQVGEKNDNLVISPLSTEVVRMMEADGSNFATATQDLATRLSVPAGTVLRDVNTAATGAATKAMLAESNALSNRFAYAITKLDRGDLYPDALAVPGGDPRLKGNVGATPETATTVDTRKPITFEQSQHAAFNIEGIPRYDHIFVVMLENKATSSILNSPFAPKINTYLNAGNQLTNYYATGNPSEPNYTALGGGDDFGISDDSQWNCDATGANAVQDLPEPTSVQPGLARSPFTSPCTQAAAVNHNIVGKPNLFNVLTSAGLTWRTYNESMNPGQDIRVDSVADAAVIAKDYVYAPGTLGGNTLPIGNTQLNLPLPAGLYKTKHHPGMAYQNVRSAPEFKYSNRTMGGGQWDAALKSSTAYAIPADYDYDQFSTDLASGNVGNLNFVVPDQCDDMHGITVKGTIAGTATIGTASDCGSVANNVPVATGGAIITRGDNYVDWVVKKIQGSPLWRNPRKRVAIVLMFDEGSATSGFNSCCGWNPGNSTMSKPLTGNADGTWSVDTSINNYTKGNRGHGQSIFGILNNQPNAPKGISDGDAYSHFSLVRTFQDMFQLADPRHDGSYMNRSKYTEAFITANILKLPEYAGSADTHFDSVRPINHAFVAPAAYTQKQSADVKTAPHVGPDASQANVWAVK
jgi:hypothetical protein